MTPAPTIHATAVLVGRAAVLLRGAPGAGKSRLAHALIAASARGTGPFARLVADDRVHLVALHGRVLASPPPALAGLIEIRGIGIVTVPFEPLARIDLVVDLVAAPEPPRLPEPFMSETILGVTLPLLTLRQGEGALQSLLEFRNSSQ